MYTIYFRVIWFNCLVASFMSKKIDGGEYVKRFCRSNFKIVLLANLVELFNKFNHVSFCMRE